MLAVLEEFHRAVVLVTDDSNWAAVWSCSRASSTHFGM